MPYVTVLAFIEFLQGNGLSHASIEAYVSSLKSQFRSSGLPLSPFTHHAVLLALRSMAINVPVLKKTKGIFDLSTLHAIVNLCDQNPLGFVYKPLCLLAFFAFLRLSNMAPPSVAEFSPLVHLYRGDVIPQAGFATVVLKWSKSLQKQTQFATIQIPALGAPPLCPMFPLPPNSPLFAIPQGSQGPPWPSIPMFPSRPLNITGPGLRM